MYLGYFHLPKTHKTQPFEDDPKNVGGGWASTAGSIRESANKFTFRGTWKFSD